MKLAVMQPYFFPYIGYFQLIKAADRFILFDDVQYIRHGWINRNRVLKPVEGWQYIIAPLQPHNRNTLIKDIHLAQDEAGWKEKIIRQMEHYKKRAPYYKETIVLLQDCFNTQQTSVVKFNAYCLSKICNYLDIPYQAEISSEIGFDYSNVNDAGEWALHIATQFNAAEYINPSGGRELFVEDKFKSANIKLSFLQSGTIEYAQQRPAFEAGLSILDLMMFNSKEKLQEYLEQYSLS